MRKLVYIIPVVVFSNSPIKNKDYHSMPHPIILLCEGNYYYIHALEEFLNNHKQEALNFSIKHNDNFIERYKKSIESKRNMLRKFDTFKDDTTREFNRTAQSKTQIFEYISNPKMDMVIKAKSGKQLDQLSSGLHQIELLNTFSEAVKELDPNYVFIDEPEIHLNQGQMPFLTDSMQNLAGDDRQIFIATHSTYMVRNATYNTIKYIKLQNSKPTYIQIEENDFKKYVQYPEIFFAEKIILVESESDALLIQRTLDILLKDKYKKTLSSMNIYILATNGKHNFKKIIKLIFNKLEIPYFVITDYDFMLRQSDYNFLPETKSSRINELVKEVAKKDHKETINRFRSLSDDAASVFVERLNSILISGAINKEDIEYFEDFKTKIQDYKYTTSFVEKFRARAILKIFKEENVWLLENYKIENYVFPNLLAEKKLSLDKLNSLFYPVNKKDLPSYITKSAIKEFEKIAKLLNKKFAI